MGALVAILMNVLNDIVDNSEKVQEENGDIVSIEPEEIKKEDLGVEEFIVDTEEEDTDTIIDEDEESFDLDGLEEDDVLFDSEISDDEEEESDEDEEDDEDQTDDEDEEDDEEDETDQDNEEEIDTTVDDIKETDTETEASTDTDDNETNIVEEDEFDDTLTDEELSDFFEEEDEFIAEILSAVEKIEEQEIQEEEDEEPTLILYNPNSDVFGNLDEDTITFQEDSEDIILYDDEYDDSDAEL